MMLQECNNNPPDDGEDGNPPRNAYSVAGIAAKIITEDAKLSWVSYQSASNQISFDLKKWPLN